jgi:hypothetical protein
MARTKRQQEIPGTERKAIAEIDSAAEAYIEVRDERMVLTKQEVEKKGELMDAMRKHKLDTYCDENAVPALLVTLVPGEDKVKVRRAEDEDEGAESSD